MLLSFDALKLFIVNRLVVFLKSLSLDINPLKFNFAVVTGFKVCVIFFISALVIFWRREHALLNIKIINVLVQRNV